MLIFGEIQNARCCIDGHRLVTEPAQRAEWFRHRAFSIGLSGNLKHPAVVALGGGVIHINPLFARKPSAPRSRPPRTIVSSAGQGQPVGDECALFGVVDHRSHAAEERVFAQIPSLAFKPRSRCAFVVGRPAFGRTHLLVVAHQDHFITRTGESSHAVVLARNPEPVRHLLASAGDDRVIKTFGKVELSFGVRDQTWPWPTGRVPRVHKAVEPAEGRREGSCLNKRTSIKRGHEVILGISGTELPPRIQFGFRPPIHPKWIADA